MTVSDPVVEYDARFNWYAALGAGVWLVFLVPAVQAGWNARDTMAGSLGLCALAGFCVLYVWSFIWGRPYRQDGRLWRAVQPRAVLIVAGLFALGAIVVLTLHHDGLATAVYVAVAGITLLPRRWSLPFAALLAIGAETLARTIPGWQGADGIALSVLLAGFAVWGMWTAMRRSRDLVAAKEENGFLMIDQERARMARDLHDILGHSLTVIAVKAELADRLVDVSPERARAEIADIQRLSRDALADVRQTVEGVRELSLTAELARARAALRAAEIEADLPGSTDDVPSDLRELFAWTLREGVTNVVRHSAATRCTVTLTADRITIADDGRGMRAAVATALRDGHGLSGLRERAAAEGAQLLVETPPGGGFSLSVVTTRARAATAASPPSPAAAASRQPPTSLLAASPPEGGPLAARRAPATPAPAETPR
jgi:two-component system sensor histidine kinase DesK